MRSRLRLVVLPGVDGHPSDAAHRLWSSHCPRELSPLPIITRRQRLPSAKALVERTKIDYNSLVSSAADLFEAVGCRHPEVNSFSLDVDYLGRRAYVETLRA